MWTKLEEFIALRTCVHSAILTTGYRPTGARLRIARPRQAPPRLANPLEVAIGATILSDGVQPFVDLDRLEFVDAERDAGEGPERPVVAVLGAELDLVVTLAIGGVAGQIEPEGVDVLLDELQRALAADQLDALVPGTSGGDPGGFDVTGRPISEFHQERRGVVVLDLAPGRVEIGATAVPEDAGRLGTLVMKVRLRPTTELIGPTSTWASEMMWAPRSPSAPLPESLRSNRQVKGTSGSCRHPERTGLEGPDIAEHA